MGLSSIFYAINLLASFCCEIGKNGQKTIQCRRLTWPLVILICLLLAGCGDDVRIGSPAATPAVVATHPIPILFTPTAVIAAAGSHPFTPLPTSTPPPATPTVVATPTSKSSVGPEFSPTRAAATPLPKLTGKTPALPTKPDDAATAIANYLNQQADTKPDTLPKNLDLVEGKLKALLLSWKATGPNETVMGADLNKDGQLELVTTFAQTWNPRPSDAADPGYLLVLQPDKNSWKPFLYRKTATANGQQSDFSHPSLLAVISMTKRKYPEIAFSETSCNGTGCTSDVHIVNWYGGKWYDLTPLVPEMQNAQKISFENVDNNDILALEMTGGVVNTLEAGPQRARTDIYRYDAASSTFHLSETTYAASDYLYFRVQDGNEALLKQNYDVAIAAYQTAIADPSLKIWAQVENLPPDQVKTEHDALVALARFRLGITYLLKGNRQQASDTFAAALKQDNVYAGWTQAFIAPYQAHPTTATVSDGCAAAVQYSQQHPALVQPFNNFGYNAPLFQPQDICSSLPTEK